MSSNQESQDLKPRNLWQYPWGYPESFMIAVEVLILGLVAEVITGGRGISPLHAPYNIYVGFSFLALLLSLHIFYRKHSIVRWLSSVPASVSAISLFAVLVLLLGFIPQDAEKGNRLMNLLGLTHMKTSWPFLFAQVYFLLTLGLVALRRSSPLTKKNIGFLLNHAGLWITIMAGALGSGDLKRLQMDLYEGVGPIDKAHDSQLYYQLPFSARLIDFELEFYRPKFALVDARTMDIKKAKGESFLMAEDSIKGKIGEWKIELLSFSSDARILKDSVFSDTGIAGGYVAEVRVTAANGSELSGHLSTGSLVDRPRFLSLNESEILVLLPPEPKKYSSHIELIAEDQSKQITLEVNKPFKFKGWKLYQMDYDSSMGEHSNLSVIEAVHDPWLLIVYTGIFMLLAGALYLFWIGKDIKVESENPEKQ